MADTKSIVERMPEPNHAGRYTDNIDRERIQRALEEMLQEGPESMRAIIALLGEPGSDEDVKPHYAAHCLENQALVAKNQDARRQMCLVISDELHGDHSDYVKGFLCQILQWTGGKESVAALGKLLTNEALTEPASMALVAIGEGAADAFRAALPKSTGKCRLNIVHGLAAVGDPSAAPQLREALSDDDREVRLAAGWGLAKLGDPTSVEVMLKAADVEPGWERIQATRHCLVLAEQLAASGAQPQARRIYEHLRKTRTESENHVRESAQRGLVALTGG